MNARRATARALESLRDEFAAVRAVRLVAAGKAAVGMAEAATAFLGPKLSAAVITAVTDGARDLTAPGLQYFPSSHPLPNDASEAAGRAALALAAGTNAQHELLLVCLSGGASAMLSVPVPGLTLADKRAASDQLLRAGLDIGSMNVVRRHLSAIKGGQLAAAAGRTITLAISDVVRPVEDDPLTIGSGPTVGDTTTFEEALQVIERAGIGAAMPPAVLAHLTSKAQGPGRSALGSSELGPWALGRGPDSGPVPPDDPRLRQSAYWVVCSRQDAMRAAADTARQIGYRVVVLKHALAGEAREAPAVLFDAIRDLERPACVIASGETTVRVRGRGQGGRNQELCVAALERLHGLGSAALASVGTDGIDGPTDAAGGIVDSESWDALGAGAARMCADALENNDAYPLLERLGGLIRTGPTGTNVGDLQVMLLT